MTKPPAYRIVEKVGEGGMGTVYRAEDTQLHRDVAIKVLRIDPERNLGPDKIQEIQSRFQKEGQAAARLNHPNIVSIYQVGKSGQQPYIVMEYLKGRSLVDLMDEEASIPQILRVMIQVCDALNYAHRQGVVHRDVKPDNIVVVEESRVKIMDFGIARVEEPDLNIMQTRTGVLLGSPAYCAPEQLKDFRGVDGRADIFSAGVILYQWLTGRLPFPGEAAPEIVSGILTAEPIPPRSVNPKIPTVLESVVLMALAKDPKERFQTAGEFQSALEQVLGRIERVRTEVDGKTMTLERRTRGGSLHLPLVVAGLLLLGTVAYGFISLKGEREILEKNANLRGTHMARMLEVVGVAGSSPENVRILQGYLRAMGKEGDIVFLEVNRGERTLAKFTDPERIMQEADVYIRGFPLRMEGGEQGVFIVGFSKAQYNARIAHTWMILIVGAGLSLGLLGAQFVWRRMAPPRGQRRG
jgi:serine/threonine-protein kinase